MLGTRSAIRSLLVLILAVPMVAAQGIDEAIASHVEAGTFAGVILIHHGGGSETFRAVGSAVREFAVPHARDTRFKYHSLTKPMTSVAAHASC